MLRDVGPSARSYMLLCKLEVEISPSMPHKAAVDSEKGVVPTHRQLPKSSS